MKATAPHRAATAAELADESARVERALTGRQLPRTVHALCEQAPRLLACEACGARPASPCTSQPVRGYHLARFAAARRRALLTAAEMDTVLDVAGPVITNSTLVRDEGNAR